MTRLDMYPIIANNDNLKRMAGGGCCSCSHFPAHRRAAFSWYQHDEHHQQTSFAHIACLRKKRQRGIGVCAALRFIERARKDEEGVKTVK